ncbi:MAG: 3,4-dioxygenase subunit beta [Leifsonia xyli]|nr:MAG: 3,4-dioxygenase subunit beta [Leifsonia xyli]
MSRIPEPTQTPDGPAYEGRLLDRADDEVVDQGAPFDMRTLVTRRTLLGAGVVGASAVALAACTTTGTTTSGSTTSGGSGTTTTTADGEIPEETNGPYPADGTNDVNVLEDSGIVRSDITSSLDGGTTVDGVPLTMTFTVTDMVNDNAPFEGAALYAWQCDAQGLYSMYSQGVEDETYLRGIQVADANGQLSFQTIVPGCYQGRWTHIHFEVYPDAASATDVSNAIATSQLAFPPEMLTDVYALDAYSGSAENLARVGTQVSDDDIFGEGDWSLQVPTVSGDVSSGYIASLNVAIDTSTAADRGGSTGGGGGMSGGGGQGGPGQMPSGAPGDGQAPPSN